MDFPSRTPGFDTGPAGAPLQLEIHVDLLCPDSAAVWPTMMELKSHYGNSLNLKVHNFILPYHRQSFEAATATFILSEMKADMKQWFTAIFKDQALLWNDVTANMTQVDVRSKIAQIA